LIFSPSEGEKRSHITRRLESLNGDWLWGSAPASGAANRALAVGMESRKASPDAETESVFRGGAEEDRRGRLRSPWDVTSRDRRLTESMSSISLSINTTINGPTILARVIEPSNNNKT